MKLSIALLSFLLTACPMLSDDDDSAGVGLDDDDTVDDDDTGTEFDATDTCSDCSSSIGGSSAPWLALIMTGLIRRRRQGNTPRATRPTI